LDSIGQFLFCIHESSSLFLASSAKGEAEIHLLSLA